MAIDPYTPCPGGTGKKIKFCCPDLVNELDKVQRMLEGEQRAACLEYIEQVEAKYADRACLMSVKAMLQAQLGKQEQAETTLATYLEKYPDNPVALAEQATVRTAKEGGRAAIEPLQRAIELCGSQMPHQVYDAIGVVAQMLLVERAIPAARAHLILQLSIGGGDNRSAAELLVRINGSPSVPMLFKQDLPMVPPPDDALWKNTFSAALELAARGAWLASLRRFEELAQKAGDWPAIARNIATLKVWLADKGAPAALRKYTTQKDVPLDDAVEAEALAQLLDEESADFVELLTVTYPVSDFERLQAQIASNSSAVRMPIDLSRLAAENEPPPKGAYWLLDRAVPASGVGLKREDVPRIVGQVFLFGKQTDREARLELVAYRPDLAEAQRVLAAVAGDAIGAPSHEEVTTRVPGTQHILSWNWRLPDDTPPEHRVELIRQERRLALLERWPALPQRIFGGKSAAEQAANPEFRIPILAAILLLELASEPSAAEFDFNELRRKLGPPESGPIDPWKVDVATVPLARLHRLDTTKLSDEELLTGFQRAEHFHHVRAIIKLGLEIVNRPALDKKVDKAGVYGLLAEINPDTREALGYLDKARQAAEAEGKSSGPWDIAELTLRISRGEVAEADRLLAHIRDEHLREPGIAQGLYQVLAEAGVIGPGGIPAAAPQAEAPGVVVPGAAAEPGKIWTPGMEPTGTGGKKSTLWTPD